MGKSSVSCFKIITCGSESVEHDDLQTPETKSSSDQRGWSFRKRSPKQRVLNNTVISETASSAKKEIPESASLSLQTHLNATVPEKASVIQPKEEKIDLSAQLDSKLSEKKEIPEPDSSNLQTHPISTVPEETSVTQLTEEKTELSVQLNPKVSEKEETSESDSLNCQTYPNSTVPEKTTVIQPTEEKIELPENESKTAAILDESNVIVIQAAIRGSLAQRELLNQKSIIKVQAVVRGHLVRCHAAGTLRCVQAIVKMQALVRARQTRLGSGDFEKQRPPLLFQRRKRESNPNGTYSYISIEKLLSNSFARQLMESSPRTKPINIKCEPLKSDSSWKWLERWMAVSEVITEEPKDSELAEKPHEEENIAHSEDKVDISLSSICSSEPKDLKSAVEVSGEASENEEENLITYDADNTSTHLNLQNIDESNSMTDVTEPVPAPIEVKEPNLISELEVKPLLDNEVETGIISTDQPETEAKKFSRKASNPAFIAAQSKFEELTTTSAKSTISYSDEPVVEPNLDKVSSSTETELAKNTIVNPAEVQIGGSECGTELSISSTLDSPDRSEQEPNIPNSAPEANGITEKNQLEGLESINSANSDYLNSATALEKESEADQKYPSPEGSPTSHITVTESQATPSSQISVKPKKKSDSKPKIRSISNPNHDSPSRSSSERKTGKRRNSFGAAKPEVADQEPRDSSSSNSIPSYMQATESARAKAIANGSPRSSPDLQDKEIFIKKRHSLPGSNGRQGSPKVQRSLSQAQQNAKGNGNVSPQDRKWRR